MLKIFQFAILQIEFLLFMWIEMCFATFFATINVNTDGMFSKGSIMEPLYYSVGAIITRISFNITYIALIGLMELFFSGYGFWRHPFSLQTNCWMMVAIVVMSVLSITALGAFFFIKKRKEQ